MGLETGTYLTDLVTTNPVNATDPVSEGAGHLRLIKTLLQNTFPGFSGVLNRVQNKAIGYTAVLNDNMSMIRTTAHVTVTLTSAATLGNGWCIFIFHDGAEYAEIAPTGAETINGLNRTHYCLRGEVLMIWSDGTSFFLKHLHTSQYENPIINGDARVIQAIGPGSATVTALAGLVHGPDMWGCLATGASSFIEISRSDVLTATPAVTGSYPLTAFHLQNKALVNAVSTGLRVEVRYGMEGYDFQPFTGLPFNLSFQAKSSVTGTYAISLRNSNATYSYVEQFSISTPNVFELKQFQIPAAPLAGVFSNTSSLGLIVSIVLGAGSLYTVTNRGWTAVDAIQLAGGTHWSGTLSASFHVTALTMWPGSKIIPYSPVPFAQTLQRCQRYYFKTFKLETRPIQSAGSGEPGITCQNLGTVFNDSVWIRFPEAMRSGPTTTTYNISAANNKWRVNIIDLTAPPNVTVGNRGGIIESLGMITVGGTGIAVIHATFDARLLF